MAIEHRIKPKYQNRIEQTVANLRATAGADAPRDPRMMIKKKIADLAYLMALVHGGEWRVEQDPHGTFVLLSRRQRRRGRKS